MKHLFALLCCAFLLVSCEKEENEGFVISGTSEEIQDGSEIYVQVLDENNQPKTIDTAVIENGKFELDLPEVEHPEITFLTFQNLKGNVVFVSENEKINFEIYKDSLRASKITGGPENELFSEYINHLTESEKRSREAQMAMQQAAMTKDSTQLNILFKANEKVNENDKLYKRKLIEANPDKLASIIALRDLMNVKAYSTDELKKIYASLSENVKSSHLGQAMGKHLESLSAVDIGGKAPNFSAPTPTGEQFSLEEAMGKVTIIDFWASWCKPCRIENPNVVRIYNKYHDKGLNIIGVSLDKASQKDKWLGAIEEDKLTWHHVSNLQFWQEPIAQTYGVRSIPATFILNEDGIIVAKDLRGDALEAKIAQLLGDVPAAE
ncbi:MAG TPA: TlpA disulfide reductase family protein [Salinimicrobium sp.]|nr:TlpA disulfide reductase family protein [Salinimicrobium sp.]